MTDSAKHTPDMNHTPDLRSNYGSPRSFGNTWEPNYQLSSRFAQPHQTSPPYSDGDAARVRSFERYHAQHTRNDSGTTGGHSQPTSHADYDSRVSVGRRHDYDVQSMEIAVSSPRPIVRNPIPAPTVTVRSEFPTLSRSVDNQSLTCLVTVEVVEGNWRPDPEDLQSLPTVPSPQMPSNFVSPKPSFKSNGSRYPRDPPEVLRQVAEELYHRVENWHGLDYSRVGKLVLHGVMRVG